MSTEIRLITLLFMLTLSLVTGCRQQAPADTASLQIDLLVRPEPVVTGDAEMIVTVTDSDGNAVNDATVAIRGDMSHAGMVPVLRQVTGGEAGEYSLPFTWTMGGDWFIDVTVTLPDGSQKTARFEYSVRSDP